jgi:hypothetical protein
MAIVSANGAATPLSPNYIINGAFDIWQRGTSFTSSGFTADRWSAYTLGGTVTNSRQSFALGQLPISGFGEEAFFWRSAISGQSAVSHASFVSQKIEDVRTFAGQTITLSFWAKAASGTPKIGLEYAQGWGTGGSSSVTVAQHITAVTIGTSWNRYTATITLPSIAGKTLGTNDNSYLEFGFWLSGGSDWNSRSGSIGIQNNTFDIWGVQLEAGSIATPFRRNANSLQGELAACQRYYYRLTSGAAYTTLVPTGITISSSELAALFQLPVTMRIPPTSIDFSTLYIAQRVTNNIDRIVTSANLSEANTQIVQVIFVASSGGLTTNNFGTIKSNNSAAAFVGFSAEL